MIRGPGWRETTPGIPGNRRFPRTSLGTLAGPLEPGAGPAVMRRLVPPLPGLGAARGGRTAEATTRVLTPDPNAVDVPEGSARRSRGDRDPLPGECPKAPERNAPSLPVRRR